MVITLITDFGVRDAYVGSMKGVILGINPNIQIVDISHEVEPGDVQKAAFLLLTSYPFFPKGTVHIVVVDPGVGSERKILCVRTRSAFFIAPDNGCLSPLLRTERSHKVRELKNQVFFRRRVRPTFHGRDKIASVAAHLAGQRVFCRIGPPVRSWKSSVFAQPLLKAERITGEILHVDRFGNLVTNIQESHLRRYEGRPRDVKVGSRIISSWIRCYSEGVKGQLALLINSAGYVEISTFLSSAAHLSRAKVGTPVTLKW